VDEWGEERAYLQQVTEAVSEELSEIDRRFERGISAADEAAEESVRRLLESRFRTLKRAEGSPYFARIDFLSKKNKEKIYIGKTSVYDRESRAAVTDWRAPISSLYYDSRLGSAVYDSPDGKVEGELLLKRRLTVENAELKGFDDIDVTATDEMLAPYLSVSADTRLKNIVATIQAGQNAVIRADAGRPLIVQGAAGSGKTTVALHRIAYLAYVLGKKFRPEQFLILSSGGFFLSYIAGVLPDLGVEEVPQLAFEDLVRSAVKASFYVSDPSETPADPYKRSYEILADIDAYLATDVSLFSKRTNAAAVYRRFLEQAALPQKDAGRAVASVRKNRLDMDDLAPLLYLRIRTAELADLRVKHVVIDEAQDFTPMQLTVLKTLYKKASFTVLGDLAQGIFGAAEDWESVNRQVWQGNASIVALQKSYRVTAEIMEAANSILGRLPGVPQGEAVVRRGEAVTYTDVWGEDDRAAACVAAVKRRAGHKNIAVLLSQPSLCHGFARLMQKKEPSMAPGGERPLRVITSRDGTYEGGLCLLPAALSKGLEFDAVIVADADHYPKNELGTKLLYVAMTRAMHTLDVMYEGSF
jgi:DNA helicase IV